MQYPRSWVLVSEELNEQNRKQLGGFNKKTPFFWEAATRRPVTAEGKGDGDRRFGRIGCSAAEARFPCVPVMRSGPARHTKRKLTLMVGCAPPPLTAPFTLV
jgi:hypothetical protein